jgi:hypothetical protein
VRREVRTALELALVAMAPNAMVERLAMATGFLIGLRELPLDTEALRVRATEAVTRGEQCLEEWRRWEANRKVTA